MEVVAKVQIVPFVAGGLTLIHCSTNHCAIDSCDQRVIKSPCERCWQENRADIKLETEAGRILQTNRGALSRDAVGSDCYPGSASQVRRSRGGRGLRDGKLPDRRQSTAFTRPPAFGETVIMQDQLLRSL